MLHSFVSLLLHAFVHVPCALRVLDTRVPWPVDPTEFPSGLVFLDESATNHSSQRDVWVHHHIWKCGGSNMCEQARLHGEVLLNGRDSGADRCTIFKEGQLLSSRSTLTFGQIQQPMFHGFPRQLPGLNVRYSVMLRNPLDQALSHFMHLRKAVDLGAVSFREWVDLGLCRTANGTTLSENCLANLEGSMRARRVDEPSIGQARSVCAGAKYYFIFQDNIQVRWIGRVIRGTVFDQSRLPGALVSEDDFRAAEAKLHSYDQVFVLDKFDEREYLRIARLLGWTEDAEPRTTEGTQHNSDALAELEPADISYLRRILVWDLALKQAADQIASQQAAAES